MEFSKQLITPSIAKALLENGINNRRIKKDVVSRYASDMTNGRWKQDTGEVIKISKEGKPIDGYHRLNAIIASGMPVWFHVASGLDEEVFDVLDTGSSRSASDVFMIKGIPHANSIPSIISTYHNLSNGKSGANELLKTNRLTNALLLTIYESNTPQWQEIGKQSHTWYVSFAKIMPPSMIGGLYRLFMDKSKVDAYVFMDQLCSGRGITNDSITGLRNTLMRDKVSPRKMRSAQKYAFIIKTWNAFRKDKTIKHLRYDAAIESFPIAL